MKVLILGSTGVLGKNLSLLLLKKKIEVSYISRRKNIKSHKYLKDFSNFKKLEKLILEINPTHIVNCLGVTHFNKDFKLKKKTSLINTKLPKFLSKFSLKNKIFFLHISTDCVFSGKKGLYNENSIKDATDLYGKTKSRGEVQNKYSGTIRTSFIGPETSTSESLLNWFLKQKNPVNGFTKAYFSGLTSLEISIIIYNHFLKKKYLYNRIINISGNRISKYSLLKKISKTFKKEILIKKYSNFQIDRSLNNRLFINKTNYKVKSWSLMLKELNRFMIENGYKF
jgi:dTDP-4-dehydrorhamnose reductase